VTRANQPTGPRPRTRSGAPKTAANSRLDRLRPGTTGPGIPDSGPVRVADVRRGSQLNLIAAAVSAVATTGITILVTRHYSKPVAGAFFTATSIFLIVGGVAGLGTNVGLTYFIARLRSLGEDARIPAIMRVAIWPVVVASIVAAGILTGVAEPLSHLILSGRGTRGGVSPANVATALRGLAVMLPFAGLLNAFLGASRGYGDMRPSAWVGQIGLTIARLIGVALAAAVGTAALIAPLWALPYMPMAVLAWMWGRRISRHHAQPRMALPDVPPEIAALLALATPVPAAGSRPAVSSGQLPPGDSFPRGARMVRRRMAQNSARGFWAFTTPRAIANTAQNILQQIDIVLVASIRGPVQAAIYTAATRFLVLGQLGGMAINRASQTRFTELFTLGDRRGANTIYRVTTAWFVVLLWPMYLLAVIFGPELLLIFGHSYTAGSLVVIILGLAMLLATACGQVDMVLITSGRSSWSLMNGLLTVGVNVGADLILIPRYGITGAAIGWAVAIVVSNLMPLIQLAVVLDLHPFGRGTFIACVITALCFGVLPFAARVALGDGVLAIAVGVVAGSIAYVVALQRFRHVLRLPAIPPLSRVKKLRLSRAGKTNDLCRAGSRSRTLKRSVPVVCNCHNVVQ
jgi:O-antigen/teichoic acid export membrane protein